MSDQKKDQVENKNDSLAVTLKLGDTTFTIDTKEGFDNTHHQLRISAQVADAQKQTVEIFNINSVSGKMHISPNKKKVTRLDIPEEEENDMDFPPIPTLKDKKNKSDK